VSRLFVIAVGKLKDRAVREAADDYLARLRRYLRADELEVKSGAALDKSIPPGALVVALEVSGRALSSPAFARALEGWLARGKGEVAFLIGGAEGIPEPVSRRADVRLSLSPMTLPHRLARVLLLEQLYRAMTILRGEPYAREE
jgi:23S rRNA (pseudouridine1915-N3)-methyltransferase